MFGRSKQIRKAHSRSRSQVSRATPYLRASLPIILQFWDNKPPPLERYYAAQRECQNAAVLQMMQAALAKSSVRVLDRPVDASEAKMNYYAFCDELRGDQCDNPEETRTISSIPRMVKCYGWMKISPAIIPLRLQVPPVEVDKRKRSFNPAKEYLAILYELVEDGENGIPVVEEVADFLWHAGFCFTLSPLERNWKSGVLVDMSDIIHFDGFPWSNELYKRKTAAELLVE